MPNPLLRGGPANISRGKRYSDDPDSARPTGKVDPIPERVAGPVFAYRGQETHGVHPGDKDIARPDEWSSERATVEYDPAPDPGPDPIPVRIVQEGSTEVIRSRFTRSYAPPVDAAGHGVAQQVIGGDWEQRRRIKVKIKNLDAALIYIGSDANSATAMSGWPLAQNEVLEVNSHEPLFALGTLTTGPQALAVMTEYSQPYEQRAGFSFGRAE
jgi:hypothetical protein